MGDPTLDTVEDETLVAELYARFNECDAQRLLQLLHSDATWINASKNLRLHGANEVLAQWQTYWRDVSIILTPLSISHVSSGFSVRVREQIVSHDGNNIFDGEVIHVVTIKDGRVICCLIMDPPGEEPEA